MENVDKTANLSQAKAVFKKYANGLVKILKSKGVKMIKKINYANGVDSFSWQSYDKKIGRRYISA